MEEGGGGREGGGGQPSRPASKTLSVEATETPEADRQSGPVFQNKNRREQVHRYLVKPPLREAKRGRAAAGGSCNFRA